jgi:hypothetical protein
MNCNYSSLCRQNSVIRRNVTPSMYRKRDSNFFGRDRKSEYVSVRSVLGGAAATPQMAQMPMPMSPSQMTSRAIKLNPDSPEFIANAQQIQMQQLILQQQVPSPPTVIFDCLLTLPLFFCFVFFAPTVASIVRSSYSNSTWYNVVPTIFRCIDILVSLLMILVALQQSLPPRMSVYHAASHEPLFMATVGTNAAVAPSTTLTASYHRLLLLLFVQSFFSVL